MTKPTAWLTSDRRMIVFGDAISERDAKLSNMIPLFEDADGGGWRNAVDAELVRIESTADSFISPAQAVRQLIDWHVQVALLQNRR